MIGHLHPLAVKLSRQQAEPVGKWLGVLGTSTGWASLAVRPNFADGVKLEGFSTTTVRIFRCQPRPHLLAGSDLFESKLKLVLLFKSSLEASSTGGLFTHLKPGWRIPHWSQ